MKKTPKEDPIQFVNFFKKKGEKGTKLYHTSVERDHLFNNRPRQEVLLILTGKVKVKFSTVENEDIAEEILTTGDAVFFSEGHVVEFLEDTVFQKVKQGPYPSSGKKDDDQVILSDQSHISKSLEKSIYSQLILQSI